MKGYGGREAPKRAEDVGVGPSYTGLMTAIEELKLAEKLGERWKKRMLRVDPVRAGVNFMAYGDDGKVSSLVEIGALPYKFVDHERHLYPAMPLMQIPMLLLAYGMKVTLIIRFSDCVAWMPIFAEKKDGREERTLLPSWRIGTPHGTEHPVPVIEIRSDELKTISPKELE